MTAKEANKILLAKYADKVVLECLEFPSFYAFSLVNKNQVGKTVGGGMYTVDKNTGALGRFSPTTDLDAFLAAKKINLAEINS